MDMESMGKALGGFGGGVLAAFLAWLKLKKNYVQDSAEINLIEALNNQIRIFSEHNKTLEGYITELRNENKVLHESVNKLEQQVSVLESEKRELKEQIDKLEEDMANKFKEKVVVSSIRRRSSD
jgi:chromosome segregation ATPase